MHRIPRSPRRAMVWSCQFLPVLLLVLSHGITPLRAETKSPPMVSIEVVLAEFNGPIDDALRQSWASDENPAQRLQQLERQGALGTVARIRLTTLHQLTARLQIGETAPVATGRTMRSPAAREERGGFPTPSMMPGATSYTMQQLGTLVSATPTVDEDGLISIEFQSERTRLLPNPPRPDAAAATEFVPQRTSSVSATTNVKIASGQTILISAARLDAAAKEESGELLILLTARLLPVARPAPPGTAAKP